MEALPVVPLISNLNGPAINLDAGRPGPGQRIQDGMQLSADGVGEFAFQLPHTIAALPQLQMPAVVLHLLIDRCRAVWVDRSHYPIGDQSQVFGSQLLGVFDQLLLNSRHRIRVQVGPAEFLHGPCHNLHLLSAHLASALRGSQMRQHRPLDFTFG